MNVLAGLLDGDRPCAVLGGDPSTPTRLIVLVEDRAGKLRVMSVASSDVEVIRIHPAIVWHPVEALDAAKAHLEKER